MEQPTFADLEYQNKKHKTRREVFLEKMDAAIPWRKLEERIRAVYAQAGKGRRPYPLAVMLRVHYVQVFHNLSDPGMEDLLGACPEPGPKGSRVGPAARGVECFGAGAR